MRWIIPWLLSLSLVEAAEGTLALDVEKPDGTPCSADLEVRPAGGTNVVKRFTVLAGRGQVDLAPGQYDLAATAKVTGWKGTKRIEVKAGQTLRYRIEVAPAPSTVGSLALVSNVPVVSGKVTSAKGVLLEGQVVIYREVQKLPLEKGRFSLAGASKGRYRIEYYDKSGSKRATKDVVVSDGGATVTIQAP